MKKEEFPWYWGVLLYIVVITFTYVIFLFEAAACRKAYISYKRESLWAAKENVATAAFQPLSPYFRFYSSGSKNGGGLRVSSGLSGKFYTGAESLETDLAWKLVKFQVAQQSGVDEYDLSRQEIEIYKGLLKKDAWRFSYSGSRIKLEGKGSTNLSPINELLRKIDTVPPYPISMPPLEIKYLKQDPRITENYLTENSRSNALVGVFGLLPFSIFIGFLFFRILPYARLPNALITFSFFLTLLFTAEYNLRFFVETMFRMGAEPPHLFLYQDGVIREIGKGDA